MEPTRDCGPRRLLFFVNDAGYFLSHRLPLAKMAQRLGYEVHMATAPGVQKEEIERHGVSFHPVAYSRGSADPLSELRCLLSLIRLYRAVRPTLVHHVTLKPVFLGGFAARIAGVPACVNAINGLGSVFIGTSLKHRVLRGVVKLVLRFVLRHPNQITIFQNADDLELFAALGIAERERTALIRGSGVDPQEYPVRPLQDGPPLVVLPSRMIRDKGVGEFVEAARMLKREGVAARFALVGGTDPANYSSIPDDVLKGWHAEGAVEWWGPCADMPAVYARSHIVCLPSYREGLPKALIEAASSGRPIVTTDVPGCREIVRHGVNGLLVPVRDPAALAEGLRSLLRDPDLRERMGSEGRRMVEQEFSLEHVKLATQNVYERLTCAQS